MSILIDTSILGRLANLSDLSHPITVAAVAELHRRGEVLHLTPQNLIEFRNFATRPVNVNGLGLATSVAEGLESAFEAAFPLLEDNNEIFETWKAIVRGLGIVGKQVHDARLIAVCHVHSVTHLLTFNVKHFDRMSAFGKGVIVIDTTKL